MQLLFPVTGHILPVCIMQVLLLVSVWIYGFDLFLKCVISQEFMRESLYCLTHGQSIICFYMMELSVSLIPVYHHRICYFPVMGVKREEGSVGCMFLRKGRISRRGGWKKKGEWYTFPHYAENINGILSHKFPRCTVTNAIYFDWQSTLVWLRNVFK